MCVCVSEREREREREIEHEKDIATHNVTLHIYSTIHTLTPHTKLTHHTHHTHPQLTWLCSSSLSLPASQHVPRRSLSPENSISQLVSHSVAGGGGLRSP